MMLRLNHRRIALCAFALGPILTTITDMSGFFLVLSLAGAVLPYLKT
jgi:Mg/Co/Ni transporter MgtE